MIDDITPQKPRRVRPQQTPPAEPETTAKAEPKENSNVSYENTPDVPIDLTDDQSVAPAATEGEAAANPSPKHRFSWSQLSKKQRILCGCAAILIAAGLGAGWTLTHKKPTAEASIVHKKVVKKAAPQPIYSKLSGLPIADASLNTKPVTAVMVENSLDARPQSGLSEAGVVFEAVAEGGVTRFMALYQDTAPTNVGPIRSARPYYVQWALGFDAAYAHVGGSTDALNDITTWHVQDMNQFYNGSSYHRISSRAAPHNVYTGIDTLNKLEANKGYTSDYTGFKHAAKAAPAATPTVTSIDMSLSGYTYNPHYAYNSTTNSYDRSEAGEPQTDANTGKQLSPQVVIAMVVPMSQGALDSTGAYYSDYSVIRSGQAYVFQNGTLTEATWAKTANTDALRFTTSDGKPLALNPGQTWITAVSGANQVQYK